MEPKEFKRPNNLMLMSAKHHQRRLSLGSNSTLYQDAYFTSAPDLLLQQVSENQNQEKLKDIDEFQEGQETEGRKAWVILAAALCFHTIIGYHFMCFGLYYITLTEIFETNKATTGLIGSISAATGSFCSIFASVFIDLYGVRKVAIAGNLMAAIGIFSSAFATNVYIMYVTYGVISGFGTSIGILCSQVIILQHFNKNRKLATSISMCGLPFGSLISPFITNFLSNTYGWRGTITLQSGIYLQTIVLAMAYSPPRFKTKQELQREDSVKFIKSLFNCSILKDAIAIPFLIAAACLRFNLVSFIDHTPSRAVYIGESQQSAGYLVTVMWIASLCARIFCSIISAFGLLTPLIGMMSVMFAEAIASLFLPLCTTYISVMVVMVIFGIAQGFMGPCIILSTVKLFGAAKFSRARAFSNVIATTGTFAATPVTGWLFDVTQNYNIPFFFSGFIGLLSVLSVFIVIVIYNLRKRKMTNMKKNYQLKMAHGEFIPVKQRRVRTITC